MALYTHVPLTDVESTDQILIRRPGSDENYYITANQLISVGALGEIGAADDANAGVIEIATSAEGITGTDTERAMTPKAVADSVMTHVSAGTTSAAGKLELATTAEAKTGTDTARAMTPANVRSVLTGLKMITFDGVAAAGPCVAVGAAVGDKVIMVASLTGGALGAAGASFEATVTVVDQIQQTAVGNLSANDYIAVLLAVA